MKKPVLRDKTLFLFDLDGVFYKGKESRIKLGGTRTVRAIRDRGRRLFVLTNNSTDTVEMVRSRLADFEVHLKLEEILTSALLTAEYLRSKHGPVLYYLLGEKGLEAEMAKCGHRRTEGEKADFVVVGLDRGLSYDKLDHAARLVRNGASIVATHSSRLYMYKTGPAVASGPIVKALEYATAKRATVIGKPAPLMFRMALQKAGCDRSQAVMIGDQVDTDIAGAVNAGIDAILVTSGIDREAPGYPLLATLSNVDAVADLL